MPAPTITALPAAPLRSQTPSAFTAAAETFVEALEDLPTEINAFGSYLDGLTFGVTQWKNPVRVASTANITLASGAENGDTLDGVVLATGDRILLKDQSTAADNGLYTVQASGAPTRATDADTGGELAPGTAVAVTAGTANADKVFLITSDAAITIGTTAQTWTQLGGGGGVSSVATAGLATGGPITGSGTVTVPAASTAEVLTGTESAKAVTPDALAALWEQGSDIASAGTISVGEGGYFHVTGTTTITDIDPATDKAGRRFILVFDGALTLTHHATTMILPTGANITTAAGDLATFVSEGSDAVRCVDYQRASGAALAAPGGGTGSSGSVEVATASAASNVIQLTGLSLSSYDALEIDLSGITVSADGEVRMQIEIAGSLVTTGYKWTCFSDSTSGTDQGGEGAAGTGINLTGNGASYSLGSGAGKSLSGLLFMPGPGSANYKQVVGNLIQAYTGTNHGRNTVGGTIENTGVVTGLKIYSPTVNITAGKVRLLRRG
jgi:hypothetical protein